MTSPQTDLAKFEVHGMQLPDSLFEHFWNEKSVDKIAGENKSPTLKLLFATDFSEAIRTLSYLGPYNTEKLFILSVILKTAAEVVEKTPKLKALIKQLEETAFLKQLASGKIKNAFDEHARLFQRTNELKTRRHKLAILEEPTLEDFIEREDLERQLMAMHALSELANWAYHVAETNDAYSRWEYLYKAMFNLKWAALGTWHKRSLHVTKRQRSVWNLQFARVFLEVYQKPRHTWRFH